MKNPISRVNELTQRTEIQPVYSFCQEGSSHHPRFQCSVQLEEEVCSSGWFNTKKMAKEAAAEKFLALTKFSKHPIPPHKLEWAQRLAKEVSFSLADSEDSCSSEVLDAVGVRAMSEVTPDLPVPAPLLREINVNPRRLMDHHQSSSPPNLTCIDDSVEDPDWSPTRRSRRTQRPPRRLSPSEVTFGAARGRAALPLIPEFALRWIRYCYQFWSNLS